MTGKRIIFSFIFSLFIFIFLTSKVRAQLDAPGVNCGNIDPPYNKCCYFKPVKIGTNNAGIPIFDPIIGLMGGAVDAIVGPVADPLNKIAQENIKPCLEGEPSPNASDPNCICVKSQVKPLESLIAMCKNVHAEEYQACEDCVTGKNGKPVGVWTGIGCVYANIKDFIQNTLFDFGIKLAGLISLACIIFAAFQLQTSRGSPEKIKKAQELLTSCIMGLMLIIFSIFILRLIGVSILKIPGFT